MSSIIAGIIGLIGFILIIYASIFLFIFRKPPMILSDWSFTKVGLSLLKNKKYAVFIFLIILLMVIYWGIYSYSSRLLSYEPSELPIYIALLIILGLGYFNSHSYGYFVFFDRTFYSPFVHFIRNIRESNKFNFLLGKDKNYFRQFNLYQDLDLENKPNIVIINIESYGAINFRDNHFKNEIVNKIREKESLLDKVNLYSASTFSTPPIFAGGSWLSYTTLLFGTKVSDQNQYELIMKGNTGFDEYQSLLRYLKTQGYKNVYLCPLGGGFLQNVEWDVVSKNLTSDQYITFDDLNYKGKTMKFMDLGISAPDQYSINKAKEIIDSDASEPYSLFFCTLNSHTPFNSPFKIEKNWSEIPNIDFDTNSELNSKKDKYCSAIKYQLDFVFDYIEKNKDDNTVYILFGDHQPPYITKTEMGWETIVHVISKEEKFIKSFKQNGFSTGLVIDEALEPIKHEGLLSLVMQALFNAFGPNSLKELPYLKNGIKFSNTNKSK